MEHVAKHGSSGLKISLAGKRHIFQAPGTMERDLWIPTLRATAAIAKSMKADVISSEKYNEELRRSRFSSPGELNKS